MEETADLRIKDQRRINSAFVFVIFTGLTVIFVVSFFNICWWVFLFPLVVALAGLEGIFRKRVISFHPMKRRILVEKSSLWRKAPKVETLVVAGVLVEHIPESWVWDGILLYLLWLFFLMKILIRRGRPGTYKVRLVLGGNPRITVREMFHDEQQAYARRDQIASVLGIGKEE